MRILFTLLVTFGVLVLHVVDNPPWIESSERWLIDKSLSLLFRKELRFEGASVIGTAEIESRLPKSRSIVWWLLNGQLVEASLQEDPRIGGAEVRSCDGAWLRSWGCFEVRISERSARFAVVLDGVPWKVSDDGAFIRPTDSSDPDARIIEVGGIDSTRRAPDVMRGILASARAGVEVLENELNIAVEAVDALPSGEFRFRFVGVPFPVTLEAPGDDRVRMRDQAKRLQALLPQLKGRENDVVEVDLAFDRVGVVKMAKE